MAGTETAQSTCVQDRAKGCLTRSRFRLWTSKSAGRFRKDRATGMEPELAPTQTSQVRRDIVVRREAHCTRSWHRRKAILFLVASRAAHVKMPVFEPRFGLADPSSYAILTRFVWEALRLPRLNNWISKTSQEHWNILMLTGTSKIAVRIEINPKQSNNKDGEVYMSVVID